MVIADKEQLQLKYRNEKGQTLMQNNVTQMLEDIRDFMFEVECGDNNELEKRNELTERLDSYIEYRKRKSLETRQRDSFGDRQPRGYSRMEEPYRNDSYSRSHDQVRSEGQRRYSRDYDGRPFSRNRDQDGNW